MKFPHAGVVPTTQNASTLISRLTRKAILNPRDADEILNEACMIEALWQNGRLPEGLDYPKVVQLTPQSPKASKHSAFTVLYTALVGIPPTRQEKCKIIHPTLPGTFYFLVPNGTLKIGPTKHQAVHIGEAQRQQLLEKGLALLTRAQRPSKAKPSILSLSDLEQML